MSDSADRSIGNVGFLLPLQESSYNTSGSSLLASHHCLNSAIHGFRMLAFAPRASILLYSACLLEAIDPAINELYQFCEQSQLASILLYAK
jgi:hypothetical protein